MADEVQDANKLFKQKQYGPALEKVNGALTTKPKDAAARFLKGLILAEQGKSREALAIFNSLTEDYPELPEPYNNLAVLYAAQGDYEKARNALEMAIRTHPSYAVAHENLGDLYAKMASQAYDKALKLDRGNRTPQAKLELIKEIFKGKSIPAALPQETVASASARNESKPADVAVAPEPVAPMPKLIAREEAPSPAAPTVTAQPTIAAVAKPPVVAPLAASETAKPEKAEKTAKVATETTKPANPADTSREIKQAVENWGAAWSAQNVKQYLSAYADNFKTPGGESRAEWEAVRTERISKPKSIHVTISDLKITVADATHASATFRQEYRASHLRNTTGKTLQLVKQGRKWLIEEERTAP